MRRDRDLFIPEIVRVNVIFVTLRTDVRAADMMKQQTRSDGLTFHSHIKDGRSGLFNAVWFTSCKSPERLLHFPRTDSILFAVTEFNICTV